MNLIDKGLNSNQLKIIAIVSMTLDHFTSVIFPNYPTNVAIIFLHITGRIAAPIMWFFIAEGYYHTHDLKKYILRLFTFAVISHFAYNFEFGIPFIPFKTSVFNQTSVIWTLVWGLIALKVDQSENPKLTKWMKNLLIFIICMITFCADWSSPGVLAILQIGRHRGNFKRQMIGMVMPIGIYSLVYMLFINPMYGAIQMFVVLVIPLLKMYNGKRGNYIGLKWLFYIYYPAHLILVGIARICLYGNISVMIGG